MASAGSAATLPCALKTSPLPRTSYRKLALQWAWQKPGSPGPRPGSPRSPLLMVGNDGVVKRGLSGLSQRARVLGERLAGGDFSLVVRGVRRADAGFYRCGARLGDARLEKVVKLYVIDVIAGRPGVPLEGSGLRLRCRVWEALPLAGVSWHRAGSQVEESGRIRLEDGGRTLRIGELGVEDQGRWQCRVSYGKKTVDASYQLEIFGFTSPKDEIKTMYGSPGASVRLSLALTRDLPREQGQAEAGWIKGRGGEGASWATGPGGANGSLSLARLGPGNLTLELRGIRASDCGLYTGFIVLDGRQVERAVRLELMEVTASLAGPVPRGASLRLTLKTSYPEGVEAAEWAHGNGSVAEGSDWFQEDGASLSIPHVTDAHSGNWTCTLHWHGETVGTASYHLDVSAFDQRVARPEFSSSKVTYGVVFTALILLILAVLGIQQLIKSRRRNFPALEVTLATVDLPVKKL